MIVRVPGGAVYLRHEPNPSAPTITLVAGYGFFSDAPTPRPPLDERRARKERR